MNYEPAYTLGIPNQWVSQWDVDNYSGRAIDPKNPPVYESQASYLKRHDLMTPEEERRLKPADFKPETVQAEPEIPDSIPWPEQTPSGIQ